MRIAIEQVINNAMVAQNNAVALAKAALLAQYEKETEPVVLTLNGIKITIDMGTVCTEPSVLTLQDWRDITMRFVK